MLTGIITLGLTSIQTIGSETPKLNNIQAFIGGFVVSFYHFDFCGDRSLGELFRRAIKERFNQCPFSNEARADFRTETLRITEKYNGELERYFAEHGKFPDRLDGMHKTCKEEQASADYVKLRNQLERFATGALTPEKILPEPCDVSPGAL